MARTGEWMSTTETEVRLGVGRAQLFRWVTDGELPGYRMGHRFRFRRADVDAFVDRARELGQVEAAKLLEVVEEAPPRPVRRRPTKYEPSEVKAMRARLAAFFEASRDLAPAPCPLCDEVASQPRRPRHRHAGMSTAWRQGRL